MPSIPCGADPGGRTAGGRTADEGTLPARCSSVAVAEDAPPVAPAAWDAAGKAFGAIFGILSTRNAARAGMVDRLSSNWRNVIFTPAWACIFCATWVRNN